MGYRIGEYLTEQAKYLLSGRSKDVLAEIDGGEQLANTVFQSPLSYEDFNDKVAINHRTFTWSLKDIDNNPIPVEENDYRPIRVQFRENIGPQNPIGSRKIILMLRLAAEQYLRKGHSTFIPFELKKAAEKTQKYLDSLLFDLLDPSASFFKKVFLFSELHTYRGSLPQVLACYLPLRLSITPSSATKLVVDRFGKSTNNEANPIDKSVRVMKIMRGTLQHAYKRNNLPNDLEKYQHYDEAVDERAARKLIDYYGSKYTNLQEAEMEVQDNVESLLTKYKLYKKKVNGYVRSKTDKRWEIANTQDLPFTKITLTAQNRNSLILILQLDDHTHLTLEISQIDLEEALERTIFGEFLDTGRKQFTNIYGIPPQLTDHDPHIKDLLINDVLEVLYQSMKSEFREIEQNYKPLQPNGRLAEDIYTRRKGPQSQRIYSDPENKPLATSTEPLVTKQNTVFYSKLHIRHYLGEKIPEKIVNQIMATIKEFEWGHADIKNLQSRPGHCRIRSGDYRIVIEHKGKRRYVIKDVLNRKNFNKKYTEKE